MDMIITYKIIHGLVCVSCSEFFVFNLGITRSNGLKLIKEHVNTNVRLQCYKNRILKGQCSSQSRSSFVMISQVVKLNIFVYLSVSGTQNAAEKRVFC